MAKTLKDLKVGDEVFVVYPISRYRKEAITCNVAITKVGRKFAYIESHRVELPFCRETGRSHHKCRTVRANGGGFDVYVNEAVYHKQEFDREQKERLTKRIVGRWGQLADLPPEAIEKFTNILDELGWCVGIE